MQNTNWHDQREPLISYAQNREDIFLARALRPWERSGFWIDIGAGHPRFDSVTALFSDFGWRGINVEPLDAEFDLLTQERSRDINIHAAVGLHEGTATLYAGPPENRGMSTLVESQGEMLLETGFTKVHVPVITLQSIVDEHVSEVVDFLKVDVEGFEYEVLSSVNLAALRPRIIVVEATLPGTTIDSSGPWESLVIDAGYQLVMFDGLNRYYCLVDGDPAIQESLSVPVNVLDNFVEYRTQIEIGAGLARINRDYREALDDLAETKRQLHCMQQDLIASQRRCAAALESLVPFEQKIDDIESRLGYQIYSNMALRISKHPWLFASIRKILSRLSPPSD